ncbi:MAG: hypothetical protein WAT52_10495, partial [Chitinophagales bacterium]
MLKHDIIPPQDIEFNIFQEVVVSTSTTNMLGWNIPAANLSNLQVLQTAWAAAWLVAKDRGNRSKAQVMAKTVARKQYEAALRPFVQQWVQLNSAVTNADRVSMNIKPRDKTRTKIPAPSTLPMVEIMPGNGSTLLLNFRQQPEANGSSRRGKPEGAASCEFYYKVDGDAPASPADCPMRIMATRSPVMLNFDSGMSGRRIWTYSRWMNATGQGGQWIINAVS